MTPEHAAIARDFEPADLRPLLDACGIDRTVLVQSACTDGDTDAMFAQAARARTGSAAVIAWVDLPLAGDGGGAARRPGASSPRCEGFAT